MRHRFAGVTWLFLLLVVAAAATGCRGGNPQVFGVGRMQKFHRPEPDALYEDVFMAPGHTHEAFYRGVPPVYPWHQYHADTDCLWLAIEL